MLANFGQKQFHLLTWIAFSDSSRRFPSSASPLVLHSLDKHEGKKRPSQDHRV